MKTWFLLCCALPAMAAMASGNFTIVGSRIYDPAGQEFLARGINLPGFNSWVGHDSTADASLIADAWGFNLVRLNCLPVSPATNAGAAIDLQAMVNAFTTDRIAAGKKPVVVMIEPHESTDTYFQGQQLSDVTAWFRDQGNRYRDNPYVWFNVGNEPGQKQKPADWPADQYWDPFQPDQQKWETMHQTVIRAIREDVNNKNVIVADGVIDGQDSPWDDLGTLNPAHSAIIQFGKNLQHFNNKTYQNILFDTHIYGMWMSPGATPGRLDQYIQAIRAQDLPLIFGEYSPMGDSNWKVAEDMVALADQYGIGRVGWSWSDWYDAHDLTVGLDLTALGTPWESGGGYLIDDPDHPGNLTPWGQFLWDDNRNLPATPRTLLPGDASDDGVINWDDYALIDRGIAMGLDGWSNGDFDGNGLVDAADYAILDEAFAAESRGIGSVVPEPAVGLMGLLLMCDLACRRRRTQLGFERTTGVR